MMPYFDRFDICEAHLLLERDYHVGGWLHERPSNQRRREGTHVQLRRMEFRPKPVLSFETLTENGQDIYRELELRFGLRPPPPETVEYEGVSAFAGREPADLESE